MGIELKMPALSPTMEEGTLAKWLVKEGDTVSSGDILAEIETDKATMEFEAVDEGVISKILVPEGTDGVKVGTAIALMGGEGEEASAAPAAAEPGARSRGGSDAFGSAGRSRGARQEGRDRHHASWSSRKPSIPRCRPAPRCRSLPFAKRCATRWPRKCAATTACS